MRPVRLDVCVLADVRVGDVAAPCHAAAVSALANQGYRVGLLPVASSAIAADPFRSDPTWERLVADGRVTCLGRAVSVECALALAFDSRLFAGRLPPGTSIAAKARIITVERPLHLSSASRRDIDLVAAAASAALGGPVTWAPNTLLARDALVFLAPHWSMTPDDWPPVLPLVPAIPRDALERARPVLGQARIARSRPVPIPGLDLYRSQFVAWRLRQGPAAPRPPWPLPSPVEVWADDAGALPDFLAKVDLLANADNAADDPCPVEALMALDAGVVPCLPPDYLPVFSGAALYTTLIDACEAARDLHGNPARSAELRAAGRDHLAAHAPAVFAARVATLIGPPRSDAFAPSVHARPPSRVLFYSSNGVGMGHLTRQLAIARRLPPHLLPVFVSHSQAVDIVRGFGFPAEHLPYHSAYGEDPAHWNAALAERLDAALGFWQPAALVYDGNVPFLGLCNSLERRPGMARIWVRRGMWGPNRDHDALDRGALFDLILEPAELADALDDGPTMERPGEALRVPPVRLLDASETDNRAQACSALGLDPAALNVLVAPGSGNRIDVSRMVSKAMDLLANRPGIGVALAHWQIAQGPLPAPPGVVRLTRYPFAQSFAAFDFAIAAAGYNSFHEHIAAALPTIWVPNEHAEQDRQVLRARFAEETGLGLIVRLGEEYNLAAASLRLLDDVERRGMRQAAAEISSRFHENGATAAAKAVADLSGTLITRSLPQVGARPER
jgi:hypothetical protein